MVTTTTTTTRNGDILLDHWDELAHFQYHSFLASFLSFDQLTKSSNNSKLIHAVEIRPLNHPISNLCPTLLSCACFHMCLFVALTSGIKKLLLFQLMTTNTTSGPSIASCCSLWLAIIDDTLVVKVAGGKRKKKRRLPLVHHILCYCHFMFKGWNMGENMASLYIQWELLVLMVEVLLRLRFFCYPSPVPLSCHRFRAHPHELSPRGWFLSLWSAHQKEPYTSYKRILV